MNFISKNTAKIISLNKLCSQKSFSTSPLLASSSVNPLKDAVRFENQNKLWTFKELEYHSNAVSYGLVELGYKPGDRLGLWLEKSYTSETVATQLGALRAGVSLVPFVIEKAGDLGDFLQESGVKGLVFSPNSKVPNSKFGEETYINALNNTIPNLNNRLLDETIVSSKKFNKLKHLIQTGFYSIPGTLKYRQILFYVNKRFLTLNLPEYDAKNVAFHVLSKEKSFQSVTFEDLQGKSESLRKEHKINEKDIIFICGESRFPYQFSLGVLNSLKHGNNIVFTGNQSLKNVSSIIKYHGDSIVVADSEAFEKSETGFNLEETKKVLKVVVNSVKSQPNKSQFEKLFPGMPVDYSFSV